MNSAGGAGAILYAEVPSFYAAVERLADPSLEGRPVLVGGHPRKGGKVQSASWEAQEAGVAVGMPMLDALERCPAAGRVRTNMKRYREAAGVLLVCLRRVVQELEPAGLGGAYIDTRTRREQPETLAGRLAEKVKAELGLCLRAGIAPAKFLAKLAAEEVGQEGVRRIRSNEVSAFLGPLSVSRLPRVGPKAVVTLQELGVTTIGELLTVDAVLLERALGNRGLEILRLAQVRDTSAVRVARCPGSISREVTIARTEADRPDLPSLLSELARGLEVGLERQGLEARRVAVRVRGRDQVVTTRSLTLRGPIRSAVEVCQAASTLLGRTGVEARSMHSLCITLAGLSPAGVEESQLDLFSTAR